MKPGLTPGVYAELAFRVTREMCPHFHGLLKHPVCATWTMVHQMELAGRALLEPHLEPDEEGIGVHLTIDHRSPAPIDALVAVRAEAIHVSAQRLTAAVRAAVGPRLVAEGTFVQAVLSKARLEAAFKRAGS